MGALFVAHLLYLCYKQNMNANNSYHIQPVATGKMLGGFDCHGMTYLHS